MIVDIIITTRGRPELLASCWKSLISAHLAANELKARIHIVINGPDPATSGYLQSLLSPESSGPSIGAIQTGRLELWTYTLSRPFTPAGARNFVLDQLAKRSSPNFGPEVSSPSDWTLFLDDDVQLPIGFLKTFERLCALLPEAAVFGGPNLTPPGSGVFARASGIALGSFFGTATCSARYRSKGRLRIAGEESLILCALFIRSQLIRELGPPLFLEALTCAEENWALARIPSPSNLIFYSPKLAVWHSRRETLSSFAQQIYKYGRGRGQLLAASPKLVRWWHLVATVALVFSLFALLNHWDTAVLLWGAGALIYATICLITAYVEIKRSGQMAFDSAKLGQVALCYPVIHFSYGIAVPVAFVEESVRIATQRSTRYFRARWQAWLAVFGFRSP